MVNPAALTTVLNNILTTKVSHILSWRYIKAEIKDCIRWRACIGRPLAAISCHCLWSQTDGAHKTHTHTHTHTDRQRGRWTSDRPALDNCCSSIIPELFRFLRSSRPTAECQLNCILVGRVLILYHSRNCSPDVISFFSCFETRSRAYSAAQLSQVTP